MRRPLIASIMLATAVAGSSSGQSAERVSVSAKDQEGAGSSVLPSVSEDGRFVAFASAAANLVPGDTNGVVDVFVKDRDTDEIERVSVDSAGIEGDDFSSLPVISADGSVVAFGSLASNLVAGDTNDAFDIFVHDRTTHETTRVSVGSHGAEGDSFSSNPSISSDGRFVAFSSMASTLVPGDRNDQVDVFVHDRVTGETERVSVDSAFGEGNFPSDHPSVSDDGNRIVFMSWASNLIKVDTNGVSDVFLRDRAAGTTTRVSEDSTGGEADGWSSYPGISGDGVKVAFESAATNLVSGDLNLAGDIFLRDLSLATVEILSLTSSGAQANDRSESPRIARGGLHVVFRSYATNLSVNDDDSKADVYLRNLALDRTWLASRRLDGRSPSEFCEWPAISSDGKEVAYSTWDDQIVVNDANGSSDVFVQRVEATDATWANYGDGKAGDLGVPKLYAESDPVLGADLTVTAQNAWGRLCIGVLVLGFDDAAIPAFGGTLLVQPFLIVPLIMTPADTQLIGTLPDDENLDGLAVYLQCLELSPHGDRRVAMTYGLELVLGY